jgi:hypothetical protein
MAEDQVTEEALKRRYVDKYGMTPEEQAGGTFAAGTENEQDLSIGQVSRPFAPVGDANQMTDQEQSLALWRQYHNDPKAYQAAVKAREEGQQAMQEIREKAAFDAQNFEKRYTVQQKAVIARAQQLKADIHSGAEWTKSWEAGDLAAMDKDADLQIFGVKPVDLPKLQPFPHGQGIGDVWVDPVNQGSVTRAPDGSVKTVGPYAKSKAGTEQARKWAEQDRNFKVRSQAGLQLMKEKDVKGNALYTPKQIQEHLDAMFGPSDGSQTSPQQQAPPSQWWEHAQQGGMHVTEQDKQLPQKIGFAQSYIRTMTNQYGSVAAMPLAVRRQYLEAVSVLQPLINENSARLKDIEEGNKQGRMSAKE